MLTANGHGAVSHGDVGAFAAHPRQGPWRVSVDWGDGSSQILKTDHAGGIGGVSHTYNAVGTYSVTTTVTDHLGNSASFSFMVLFGPC